MSEPRERSKPIQAVRQYGDCRMDSILVSYPFCGVFVNTMNIALKQKEKFLSYYSR